MRKILIIPPEDKVEDYLQLAADNGISEIVSGIPPGMNSLYRVEDLPVIHTEESPSSSGPTEIETLRLEQAQSNTELVDLVMAMLGGV